MAQSAPSDRVAFFLTSMVLTRSMAVTTLRAIKSSDAWLRTQNPQWGVRDLAEVTELAAGHGFSLRKTTPMPANNLSVIFERGP